MVDGTLYTYRYITPNPTLGTMGTLYIVSLRSTFGSYVPGCTYVYFKILFLIIYVRKKNNNNQINHFFLFFCLVSLGGFFSNSSANNLNLSSSNCFAASSFSFCFSRSMTSYSLTRISITA